MWIGRMNRTLVIAIVALAAVAILFGMGLRGLAVERTDLPVVTITPSAHPTACFVADLAGPCS